MTDWLPVEQTELGHLCPEGATTPPPVSSAWPFATGGGATPPVHEEDIKKLEQWFKIYWICLAAGIPLTLILVGMAGLIAAVVFYCLMLYKLWKLIPSGQARTSPGLAVGLSFVPFFNYYWNFVAFHGLAQDLNARLKQEGVQVEPINANLTLAYCILVCVCIVPWIGLLAAIGAIVVNILALKQIKDAGVALIRHRLGSAGPAPAGEPALAY
ncbi:MAG: hypothetical protein E1N59_643 [Puniceicoccaceae bacterium 5H]|nr:MAG: hypothetical protein E1N59_643 [Puniceicoccaceae bacterium 5H]